MACAAQASTPVDTRKRLSGTQARYSLTLIPRSAGRRGGGIRALIQRGGGKSLYAGVWGNLAGVMPASALFMAIYEPAKVHLPPLLPGEPAAHL